MVPCTYLSMGIIILQRSTLLSFGIYIGCDTARASQTASESYLYECGVTSNYSINTVHGIRGVQSTGSDKHSNCISRVPLKGTGATWRCLFIDRHLVTALSLTINFNGTINSRLGTASTASASRTGSRYARSKLKTHTHTREISSLCDHCIAILGDFSLNRANNYLFQGESARTIFPQQINPTKLLRDKRKGTDGKQAESTFNLNLATM